MRPPADREGQKKFDIVGRLSIKTVEGFLTCTFAPADFQNAGNWHDELYGVFHSIISRLVKAQPTKVLADKKDRNLRGRQ